MRVIVLALPLLLLTVSCTTSEEREQQRQARRERQEAQRQKQLQDRVETALQNTNPQILSKQLERIPEGTPGRERVVAHLEDLLAKRQEATAARRRELLVCAVQQHIDSDPKGLYAALTKRLGPSAVGNRSYLDEIENWITDVKFPGGKMQVYEESGLLDQINVWFDSPVPREDALMMFGFPTDVRPTKQGPHFFVWERTFGIDRLHFLRVKDTSQVKEAMIEIR